MGKNVYPFVAIVGQERLKKSILLNLVNPKIGGVIISGEKGTGKSTIVRSIPSIFSAIKIIDVPLNITEDRLIGGIDIEKAISFGKKEFELGILKNADGNVLYVDEVNLLDDNIINTILQVSSSGFNHIEREGISYRHSSKFILIGTMNPEEGQLKSIFLDKFGLYVCVNGDTDLENRKNIIQRRISYEEDKCSFYYKYLDESIELNEKLKNAISILNNVNISDEQLDGIFNTLDNYNCEGNRTEIIVVETAKAITALENRIDVSDDDVKEAISYVLPHRIKNTPQSEENQDNEEKTESEENNDVNNNEEDNNEEDNNEDENDFDDLDGSQVNDPSTIPMNNDVIEMIGNTFKVKNIQFKNKDRKLRKGSGKRNLTKTQLKQGRYVRYRIRNNEVSDISIDGTLRAAAPYQIFREKNGLAISIEKEDIREKVREKRTGATIFFLVDASGSISAKKRMIAVKGAIISLLTDAYEKRDKVSLIAFRKESAEVLLYPTRSVELAKKQLSELPSGGKTPLSKGLLKALELINSQWIKNQDMIPLLIVISDGRANVSLYGKDPLLESFQIAEKIRKKEIKSLVIDVESGFLKFRTLKELSNIIGGRYLSIEDLSDKVIYDSVKNLIE